MSDLSTASGQPPAAKRRFGIGELIALVTLLGGLLVFYGRITDRIAIIEVNVTNLQTAEEETRRRIDAHAPDALVEARLNRQHADLEKLEARINDLQNHEHSE